MLDNGLIGWWSADHRYAPGAASDDSLIFKPDGTGRYEFLNWRLESAILFRWETPSAGVLRIVGEKCLRLSDNLQSVEEGPSDLHYPELPYTIEEEDTPSGKRMLVLRLPLKLLIPDCFGFVRKDLSKIEEPDFGLGK